VLPQKNFIFQNSIFLRLSRLHPQKFSILQNYLFLWLLPGFSLRPYRISLFFKIAEICGGAT